MAKKKATTKNKENEVPKDIMEFFELWLVKKAPFQIPNKIKETITKFSPWINIIIILCFIPSVRAEDIFIKIVLIIQLALQIMALPGLFEKKLSAWNLLFYASIANLVYLTLVGPLVGAILTSLIIIYALFQIRTKFHTKIA